MLACRTFVSLVLNSIIKVKKTIAYTATIVAFSFFAMLVFPVLRSCSNTHSSLFFSPLMHARNHALNLRLDSKKRHPIFCLGEIPVSLLYLSLFLFNLVASTTCPFPTTLSFTALCFLSCPHLPFTRERGYLAVSWMLSERIVCPYPHVLMSSWIGKVISVSSHLANPIAKCPPLT